jgi:hypothetical protein
MTASKGFGYEGKDGTCLYCGDTLRHETIAATLADKGNPTYKVNEWSGGKTITAPVAGYEQNGYFDTLRCGFRWATEIAKLGTRLELDS